MKDIENIEEWYKDELNNYNVEPDKSTWNSLSEELDASTSLTDENISDWYKKEVSKLEERPDYTVWEKLSTRLDTASVWGKLTMSLNRYDQYILWRNLVFRGSAVFLLFLGSYLAYDNYSTQANSIASSDNSVNKLTTENNIIEKSGNTNSAYETAFNNSSNEIQNNATSTELNNHNASNELTNTSNESIKIEQGLEAKINIVINAARKTSSSTAKKLSRSKYSDSYASLDEIQEHYSAIYKSKLDELKTEDERSIYTNINRQQLTEKDISHLYSKSEFLVKKDNDKIVFNSKRFSAYFIFGLYARRVYIGFNAGIKKKGMITKFKENSALAEYKQNNFLDFGSNFGGTVGFIISDNFNLEANINLNSTSGYKRAFNSEGISYKENLNLNYTSISLLAKKMNNKSTFDNKVYSTNLIGGFYASYLRTAVSDVNGVSRSLDEYNNTDFGIVFGIEQDRYISKTFVITPGIRYNQGLTNNANENSPFESSRNFSFEFNLGVKYIFLKKRKK